MKDLTVTLPGSADVSRFGIYSLVLADDVLFVLGVKGTGLVGANGLQIALYDDLYEKTRNGDQLTVRSEGSICEPRAKDPDGHFWQNRNWHLDKKGQDENYSGCFVVRDKKMDGRRIFRGSIVMRRGLFAFSFIADLPEELRGHGNEACFRPTPHKPWFNIHWEIRPASPESAIIAVERLFSEVINR